MSYSTFTRTVRRPMRKVSEKRQAEDSLYWKLRNQFLIDHRTCQFPKCLNGAIDIHHVKGRYGKNFLDVKSWKALCRNHHSFLHENPNEARRLGLLK